MPAELGESEGSVGGSITTFYDRPVNELPVSGHKTLPFELSPCNSLSYHLCRCTNSSHPSFITNWAPLAEDFVFGTCVTERYRGDDCTAIPVDLSKV